MDYVPKASPIDQLDLSKRYTYADYLQWEFKERVELVNGFIHKMDPAPGWIHQKVFKHLIIKMNAFFESKSCELFVAPCDIRLPDSKKQVDDKEIFTVVQPDLGVICDPDKIDYRGCIGAPDMIIEVLTSESTQKDIGIKYKLYREHGVKEYWLVDPEDKVIFVNVLRNGEYVVLAPFTEDDEINSDLFPELKFTVNEIFKDV